MNRRDFLKYLGVASVGAFVPSVAKADERVITPLSGTDYNPI